MSSPTHVWLAAVWLSAALSPSPAAGEESPLDSLLATLSVRAAEGLAGLEQHLAALDPIFVDAAAPFVASLIADSRDAAIAAGVEPIPPTIRAELEGYVADDVLDRVRWCAGCGGVLSLQQTAFRFGYAPAITLDHVVVFERREDALMDPSLWAHELWHVVQFTDWGIGGFAERYLSDQAAIEHDAAEFRWAWVKRNDWLARRKAQRAPASQ
jgi:hypothetical protein